MDRRSFLASGAAAAAVASSLPNIAFAQAPVGPADDALDAAFDRIFATRLQRSPELATQLGMDKGPNAALKSRLADRSLAGQAADLANTKQAIAALDVIDTNALSPAGRLNREVVGYSLRQQTVGPEQFGIDTPVRPFTITQQQGAYFSLPDFLNSSHVIATVEDADAYLARLDGFATAIEQDSETQRAQAARGYLAPIFSLDLALGQLMALRDKPAGESGLVSSLARRMREKGLTGNHVARATTLVETKVFPALDSQIALVRGLRGRATADAGVWRLRDGEALYAAALKASTTTELTAQQIHDLGLEQVAEISAQIDTILKGQGMSRGSIGARLTALNASPAQLYPDSAAGRADLLAGLNAGEHAMEAKLAGAFLNPPTQPLDIRAVPVEIQDGASNGYYRRAALDGSRPAIYFINLKDVADWPKYSLPSLTYHEGVPGHHLQISIAQGAEGPLIRKIGFFGAYTEGWALYAEGVADELGGYADPLERAGFLQSYLFRAARLVVDTGIHTKRWSREQATDYLVDKTGFARPRSQREVERYCTQPGQACSYKVGHMTWVAARQRAKDALGPRFDLKQFHEVLREGAVPLTILDRLVDERIAAAARA